MKKDTIKTYVGTNIVSAVIAFAAARIINSIMQKRELERNAVSDVTTEEEKED